MVHGMRVVRWDGGCMSAPTCLREIVHQAIVHQAPKLHIRTKGLFQCSERHKGRILSMNAASLGLSAGRALVPVS